MAKLAPESELFYVWKTRTRVDPKYLCAVVVVKPDDAFVLTAYQTDTVKKGQVLFASRAATLPESTTFRRWLPEITNYR